MSSLFPRLEVADDATALRVADRVVTYRELAGACVAHVERLAKIGVHPGDRVAVFTDASLEALVTLVANAAGGLVTVPIDPKMGDRELAHVIADSDPVLAIAADPESVRGRTGVATLHAEIGVADPARYSPRPLLGVSMLVLYTSGTTGAPKGALLSSMNVAAGLDALFDAWAWTANDTVVHALPLFHVHGLVLGLFGALRSGGSLHWVPKFSPEAMRDALAEQAVEGGIDRLAGPTASVRARSGHSRAQSAPRALLQSTLLFSVPTMVHRLAEAAENDATVRDALASARLLVSGSAALPVREQQRFEKLLGKGFIERYGMTETLITCAVRAETGARPGYVGPPVRGVELRLVDDARKTIDARDDATLGEIAVRGAQVFMGYLNRDDATSEVRDADGWFYTGDLAAIAADGAVRIVGRRATDLIKCAGFKVGAGEVEAALLEHPSVREAAVVGAPDADLGEKIVAFVVSTASGIESALIDHVAQSLSPHKRPREVRIVSALPRNAIGKVQKRELLAMLAAGD
jgi:malonyl-CoA/methylmalonyl-CoA synthetase